jgi:hypothetical protein
MQKIIDFFVEKSRKSKIYNIILLVLKLVGDFPHFLFMDEDLFIDLFMWHGCFLQTLTKR